MILDIARVEFRARWRDGRTRLAAALFIVMLIASLATAAARYSVVSAERTTAQRLVEDQWLGQGQKNPHAAAHYGLYAFQPADPLTFFDPGVSAYEGVSIWLEAHRQNLPEGRLADDLPALARFGELSLAFTLQVLLPLLIILLAYDAFAGERERGTLRQLLSQGVRPRALLWGKFVGLAATLLAIVLPAIAIGLVALGVATGARAVPAAIVLIAMYLLYGAVFVLFSLTVSALARSSQIALIALLGFWVTASFVVPRIAADAGRILHPLPSSGELERSIETDMQGASRGTTLAERIERRREQVLALYRVADVAELPVNYQGLVFAMQEEFGNEIFDRHFGELTKTLAAQTGVYEAAAIASPRLAMTLISQELAGTSPRQMRVFATDAENFRRRFIALLNDALLYNAQQGTPYVAGPALWSKVGEYRYVAPTLGARLAVLGAPLTVLVLWLAATVAAASLAVRRLRVSAA